MSLLLIRVFLPGTLYLLRVSTSADRTVPHFASTIFCNSADTATPVLAEKDEAHEAEGLSASSAAFKLPGMLLASSYSVGSRSLLPLRAPGNSVYSDSFLAMSEGKPRCDLLDHKGEDAFMHLDNSDTRRDCGRFLT